MNLPWKKRAAPGRGTDSPSAVDGGEADRNDGQSSSSLLSRSALAAAHAVWTRRDLLQQVANQRRALLAVSFALVASITLNFFVVLRPARYVYFATQPDGALIHIVPLSRPIMSASGMSTWVSSHVARAFNLSWTSYRSEQMRARKGFTESGWEGYLKAVHSAHIIGLITKDQYNLTAAVTGAPVLLNTGVAGNGHRWWEFQFPMVLTYNAGQGSQAGTNSQQWVVTALVVRVPQTVNPHGILLNQIVARQR